MNSVAHANAPSATKTTVANRIWTRPLPPTGRPCWTIKPERDPVAQVEDLLWLDPILLISAGPVLKEATNRRHTLEAGTHAHRLQDGIGSDEARELVKAAAIHGLKQFARDQVGGRRALLGHRPVSITLPG